jgi:hypothetical protein
LVLYDAEGDFDRNFDWWKESGKHRLVEPQLPFKNGRSDLLTGSGSRLDIQNINLLATLLVHAQYQGYWSQLGMQFQEEMEALLQRHVLSGLVDAPWVRADDPESDDDDGFFAALQELVAYAFEESVRIKKKGGLFPGWHEIPVRSSHGILQDVRLMQDEYSARCIFAQMPAISIWTAVQLSRLSILHELSSTDTTLVSSPCSGPGQIRKYAFASRRSPEDGLQYSPSSVAVGLPLSF